MENKEYSLKFTFKAEDDLDEINRYIANNLFAPEAAENLRILYGASNYQTIL